MYNVKRHEFDPEYDNDAEMPLAELDFKESDSAQDRELKLRLLRIYNSRCIFLLLVTCMTNLHSVQPYAHLKLLFQHDTEPAFS